MNARAGGYEPGSRWIERARTTEEVGYYVPSGDIDTWVDTRPDRPRVAHSADVFVDAQGIMYVTDFNAGLHILEYKGA